MTHYDETGVSELFPGPGLEIPDDAERDRADALLSEWAARWGEVYTRIARVHPPAIAGTGLFSHRLGGLPTNRAFMRAQLRRFFRHPTGVPMTDFAGNEIDKAAMTQAIAAIDWSQA